MSGSSSGDDSDRRQKSSRREVLNGALALGGALAARSVWAAGEDAPVETVRLKPGTERPLPPRALGMNTNCVYDIPFEDAKAVAAIKAIGPNVVRFPGGTVGNYYNWRTGFMEVPDGPGASVYRRYMIDNAVPRSKQLHPQGVFIEDWAKVVAALEADLVLNPNLETSSIEEQRAWFAHMHRLGIVPANIEMGAEFYLAMFLDPLSLAVTPNWKVTLGRTKQYLQALKPFLPKDHKIAVQSAGSLLHHPDPMNSGNAVWVHEAEWDRDMRPEPWFDAVTTHFYPGLERSAGAGALGRLAEDPERIYAAMLARADEGFDRALSDTIARMPGKEIWMTEWGAFEAAQTLGGQPAYFNGLWLHQVTRGQMAMLRHREVTMSNFHSATFSGNLMSSFVRAGDAYRPINASGVLHWFFTASRGPDSHYQRLHVDGARRISAQGTIPGERFWDVEAAVFRQGTKRTLIVHNAWKTPRRIDLSELMGKATPRTAETIATPDLLVNLERGTPAPEPLAAGPATVVPPYSVSRIVWSA